MDITIIVSIFLGFVVLTFVILSFLMQDDFEELQNLPKEKPESMEYGKIILFVLGFALTIYLSIYLLGDQIFQEDFLKELLRVIITGCYILIYLGYRKDKTEKSN